MTRAFTARTMVALMLLGALSGLVVADDAGSGGDAGSSTSTAVYLPASNATYYGNLSSTDGTDYFGINMSAYPGMDEFPTDRSAQEAAQIESSNNPFEAPIQQDLTTGGVQFRSEGENVGFISKTQSFIESNSNIVCFS